MQGASKRVEREMGPWVMEECEWALGTCHQVLRHAVHSVGQHRTPAAAVTVARTVTVGTVESRWLA